MMWIRDFQEPCFNAHIMYAESDDGGQSWGRENDIMENIPLPDGNTYEWWQTRHSDFGGWGIYDSDGNPHFVFSANFGTRAGAGYYFPFLRNPIWHYSSATGVSLVTLSSPGVFPEGVKALNAYGNSHLADKPSLGEDENGYLYCVWGEFPPEHWDVSTGYPGDAEVYAARSMDNGATWGPKVNLTMTDSLCELYPTVAHVVNDTLHIIYHHDLELASYVQEDGPASDNPVIYHKVPVIPGDIEVVSIDDPPYWPDSTTYSDQIYIPKVTYHNKGTEIVAFQARFEIESPSYYSPLNEGADTIMSRSGFYYDIVDVSLDGGATTQVEFKEFDPSITLSSENPSFRPLLRYYGMACLLGDADISDNVKLDSCRVDTIVQEGIEESPALPFSLSISPNPSPGVARISYTLPSSDKITIRIFDLVGRCVVSAEEIKEAGNHTFLWNGSDDRGKELSSGVYFITLTSKSGTKGKKLLLMK
jgi:hypothetical protein